MSTTTFEIVKKRRTDPVGLTSIKDFEIQECGQMDISEILTNDRIRLDAFDFEDGQAVFVEAVLPNELSWMPFYCQAQYESVVRVTMLPIETMIGLAQSVTVDDRKVIFLHSTGRCGSTLASKLLAQLPGVINMSEPDSLTQLVIARFLQPDKQVEMKMLLDADRAPALQSTSPDCLGYKRAQFCHRVGRLAACILSTSQSPLSLPGGGIVDPIQPECIRDR